VPNQKGNDWEINNIVIDSFSTGSDIKVVNGGLYLAVQNMNCRVSADWKAHKSFIHVGGSVTVSVSQTTCAVTINAVEQNLHPQVTAMATAVSIGSFHIHFGGGILAWVLNLLTSIFNSIIKREVENAIQKAIQSNVHDGLNKVLATLPVDFQINPQLGVQYGLSANPIFSPANYVSLPQVGNFYIPPNKVPCPTCDVSAIPDHIAKNQLQLILSDYIPSSAGYVFYKLGKIAAVVKDSNIPDWSPLRLNTTSWKDLIPALYKTWPDKLMLLRASASSAPFVVFNTDGAIVTQEGTFDISVIDGANIVPAFVLSGVVQMSGSSVLRNYEIFGNLTFLKTSFQIQSSKIGTFNTTLLVPYINEFFTKGLVPLANLVLKNGGIPLPVVKGLTFVNPNLAFGNRYLMVATDVHFQWSGLEALLNINKI